MFFDISASEMSKKSWYSIRASATATATAEISIHDEIGYFGISARNFIADLRALGPDIKQINMSIHSPGGEVLDGLAIYNVLDRHPAKITATVEGLAASMASVIAMAADVLLMPKNAFLMIHNPWTIAVGDADDLHDTADLLNKMRDTALNAYEKKTKMPREELTALMDAETWMTGEEALDRGFTDAMLDPVAMAAMSFDTRRLLTFMHTPTTLTTPVSEDPAPVEPTAPVADPAPAPTEEPTPAPVEPPAPEPEPQNFVQRAVANLRSLLTERGLQSATPPVSEIDAIRARLTAAESELAILRPKAKERDDLETALAAANAAQVTASRQAAEIAANAGFKPGPNGADLPPIRDGEAGSLLDQFNGITDAAEKATFYREHRDAIRPFLRKAS